MLTDLDEAALHRYRSAQTDPPNFSEFWAESLARADAAATPATVDRVASLLTEVDVFDVRFSGWDGRKVGAWLRLPARTTAPPPVLVEYVGYGGGRGLATENLLWPACGFAHLLVDTAGQGFAGSIGITGDDSASGPQGPGFMTRGIQSQQTYYYRRVITDAVQAIKTTTRIPFIDSRRIAVVGNSQGGGIALAASVLAGGVSALVANVPFLCDFPRALDIHDRDPYAEVVRYLAVHRDAAETVLRTLSYFDGVNFARRARIPALFSAGLMDSTCKPSTVFGAFHAYAAEKHMTVWHYNGHEGGGADNAAAAVEFVKDVFARLQPDQL